MAKVGDIVRFLNAVGGGVITKIKDGLVYVEDEDGFETPVLARECVVVDAGRQSSRSAYDRPIEAAPSKYVEPKKPVEAEVETPLVVEETKEGDCMNMVLAYVPNDAKSLSTTKFTAYLVNDSNYYVYFTYLVKGDDGWTARYHGLVEPNIQVRLESFSHELLADMSRIAVQYIAYKDGKTFKLKNPVSVEHKLDGTKFYKLHTFSENEYFDVPVLAFEIVKNDVPYRNFEVDPEQLRRAMIEKKRADEPRHTPVKKHEKAKGTLIECDLHIDSLIDNKNGLSNSDMLNLQLDKFREVMNANIKHSGAKVVFIHGKGEGVLRKALLDELKKKYPRCTAQDASFKEYGFGATLITVH